MFVETVTAPREVWEHWTERLRLYSEPPSAPRRNGCLGYRRR